MKELEQGGHGDSKLISPLYLSVNLVTYRHNLHHGSADPQNCVLTSNIETMSSLGKLR